jgi:hypothetical protein
MTYEKRQVLEHFRCFARNERWGTCVDCPRDADGHVYPEMCQYSSRGDHRLGLESLVEQYMRNRDN